MMFCLTGEGQTVIINTQFLCPPRESKSPHAGRLASSIDVKGKDETEISARY